MEKNIVQNIEILVGYLRKKNQGKDLEIEQTLDDLDTQNQYLHKYLEEIQKVMVKNKVSDQVPYWHNIKEIVESEDKNG